MRHSIIISSDGDTRDEAEQQALALIAAEWAGEAHQVTRLGSTRSASGRWCSTVWSSNEPEEVQP